jgi:hypothetical protein
MKLPKTIAEQFEKINSAKLSDGNRCGLLKLCGHSKNCYSALDNWKLVGWATPPFKGSKPHAIVFEYLGGDEDEFLEVGSLYWTHGDANVIRHKKYITPEQYESFGPWGRW